MSVFIRNGISFRVRPDLSTTGEAVEMAFVEIDKRSIDTDRNLIIGCIYRPPSASLVDFNSSMLELLDALSREHKHVYMAGDFNVDLLRASEQGCTAEFINTMFSHSFFPAITKPTRITETSATVIDNIFCNIHRMTCS